MFNKGGKSHKQKSDNTSIFILKILVFNSALKKTNKKKHVFFVFQLWVKKRKNEWTQNYTDHLDRIQNKSSLFNGGGVIVISFFSF